MAENVLLTIRGDIRDIKSKFAQIEGTVRKISGTTQKQTNAMSKRFQSMGNIMHAIMGAVVIRKFIQGLNSAAIAASALESQTAKFKTVFRGSLEDANKDVEDLTENYAMSTREARQYMAAVQDSLVPMGMARNEAARFSGEIVKLSADLGSFNKMPTEQVMSNIQSALTGQYRAVRKYGVVLLDQQVRQRAVNDGLASSTEKVTALQKAMTAYTMMVEQTADAHGDMARTFGEYANVTKRTNAAMEDFKASIGKNVTPALGFWKQQLTEILTLTTDVMDLYNKEAVEVASGQDKIKQKIVELRIEQEKYIKIIESRWRIESEKKSAQEGLNKLLEEEAWWQNKLNIFVKAGKDWYYEEAEAKRDNAKATKEMTEAEMEVYKYRMGMLEIYRKNIKIEPIIDEMPGHMRMTKEQAQELRDALYGVNEEMSNLDKYAYLAAGALGGTFASIVSGSRSAEEAIKKLAFQLAAMAALSFIPGGWGQFLGGVFGAMGAPAPSPIRKPKSKPTIQTLGQQRQIMTLSTPMYGRRYIKEMNKGAVNVNTIAAWSLG